MVVLGPSSALGSAAQGQFSGELILDRVDVTGTEHEKRAGRW